MTRGPAPPGDRSSRLSGFYRLPLADRRAMVAARLGVEPAALDEALDQGGLGLDAADHLIENVLGTFALPLGLGLNFQLDGRDVLVPMCVEEPSVVAAASNAARMVRAGGGFHAQADPPVMIGQVELRDVPDPDGAAARIGAAEAEILLDADRAHPELVARGGGARRVQVRVLSRPGEADGGLLVVHVHVDCRDAMGANLVNTVAERVAPRLGELSGGRVGLRILTNLADERVVRVTARVPAGVLVGPGEEARAGGEVRDAIAAASRFAELDPYRAATHNKGIMNGVDAVAIACGQDWRGIEAGAHAWAARDGRYRPLSTWRASADGDLVGEVAMPLAVGTVGGALRVHAGARLCLAILGATRWDALAGPMAAVGLASNLAALRALATEGIQRGHMSLHARSVASAAGARGEWVELVAAELAAGGEVKPDRAREILDRLRAEAPPLPDARPPGERR